MVATSPSPTVRRSRTRSTLTLSTATSPKRGGTINATTVAGTVSQDTGAIKDDDGSLTFQSAVTKNAGTIGYTTTDVMFEDLVTQSGNGKIEANTLAVVKESGAYALGGTNNINIITNIDPMDPADIKTPVELESVSIRNESIAGSSTTANNIKIDGISTSEGLTVTKAADVELADVAAKEITITESTGVNIADVTTTEGLTITKAEEVTDSGSVAGGTLKVDSSSSVTLDETATLSIAGITSSGNVTIKAGTSLTLSGEVKSTGNTDNPTAGNVAISTRDLKQGGNAISAKDHVTLAGKTAGITVDGNVTAESGDILVQSKEVDPTNPDAPAWGESHGRQSGDRRRCRADALRHEGKHRSQRQ